MLLEYLALSNDFIWAIGWTVLHALWQGTLIAIVLYMLLQLIDKKYAQWRYRLSGGALLIILGLAFFTFSQYYQPTTHEINSETIVFQTIEQTNKDENIASSEVSTTWSDYISTKLNENIPMITLAWLLGVCFFFFRLLSGLFYIRQLKKQAVYPLPNEWQNKVNQLMQRMNMDKTKVSIRLSNWVNVPVVIGHIKPVILLPIGLINVLTPDQVESIIAHELAHIIRRDYFINILQSLIEVLFFFHPAVWWLSDTIRTEREHCCDDQAIATCGNVLTYVKALANLKITQQKTPTLAMTLGKTKPALLQRIQRILNKPQHKSTTMEKFIVTCLLLLTLIFGTIEQNQAVAANMPTTEHHLITLDTIPNMEGISEIRMEKDGKTIESTIENGVIQHLKVNGKEIPETEYVNYETELKDIIYDVPEPPMPPAPSAPTPPTPPSPPAAPNPPAKMKKQVRIIREISDDDRDTEAIVIEGEERIKIEVDTDGEHTIIKRNGEVIEEFDIEIDDEDQEVVVVYREIEDEVTKDGQTKEVRKIIRKQHEKQEELIHRRQKEIERRAENMERMIEERVIEIEKQAEALEKEGERLEKIIEIEAATIEKEHENLVKRIEQDVFLESIAEHLLNDGLIDNKQKFSFDLTGKRLKVNGKTQPKNVFEKYKTMVEDHEGLKKLGTKDKVKMNIAPNKSTIEISIDGDGNSYNHEDSFKGDMLEQLRKTAQQQYTFNNQEVREQLIKILQQDELIQTPTSFTVSIDTHNFSVNEVKLSAVIHEKYEKWLRNMADFELEDSFHLVIAVDGNTSDFILK